MNTGIEDFPEIPEFLRRRRGDPPSNWQSSPPAAVVAPAFGGLVRQARGVDPATERVRLEMEEREAQRRDRALEKKRDDEAMRRRGLKNLKTIRLAAEGKIVLPPTPVKIVKVVDLTRKADPAAEAANTEETDVKKTAAKKARKGKRHPNLPASHPANRGAAKKAAPKKPAAKKANARTPVATEGGKKINAVVQAIAEMMARPVGHKDAPLGGASMDEMVKVTGVAAHPMRAKVKQVRDALKLKVEAPTKENGKRYFIRPEKPTGFVD